MVAAEAGGGETRAGGAMLDGISKVNGELGAVSFAILFLKDLFCDDRFVVADINVASAKSCDPL